jgi:hypothetical protein
VAGGPPAARPEPPVYRPFALLAFGSTIALGVPLGMAMLVWLYGGGSAVAVEAVRLHAAIQLFAFFGTLIVGVAHHLLPRFTGRPVRGTRLTPWLATLLSAAVALRAVGAWADTAPVLAVAASLHATAFALFGVWVWGMLDPSPLRLLRRHLSVATAWLAAACALEGALRWAAVARSLPGPDPAGLQVVYAMALFGGVIGWVLGVLLRAGPMFVVDWRVPPGVTRAVPPLLAAAVVLAALSQLPRLGTEPAAALARAGDLVALGTVLLAVVRGGALRRARRALPMLSRSPAETRLFRLALGCVAAGAVLAATALLTWRGADRLLADAVRHLVTIGFLTSLVVAMTFRLIPALEGTPLRWPFLRGVALWALLGSVLLRTSQIAIAIGGRPLAYAVALSGALAWLAVAAVGLSLVAAMVARAARAGIPDASAG